MKIDHALADAAPVTNEDLDDMLLSADRMSWVFLPKMRQAFNEILVRRDVERLAEAARSSQERKSSLRIISIPRDLDEVLAQEPLTKAEMGADYLRYLIRTQEIRETLADMLDHMGETECDGSFFGESQADRIWWAKRTEQLAKDFAALRPEAKAAREVVQPPLS